MSEFNEMLQTLWSLDAPQAEDRAFVVGVLEKIEQRRYRASLLKMSMLAVLASLACLALAPMLQPVIEEGLGVASDIGVMVTAAVLLLIFAVDPSPSLGFD